MSVIFDDKYIDGYFLEDNILNNDIYKIITFVKNGDYKNAMSIFKTTGCLNLSLYMSYFQLTDQKEQFYTKKVNMDIYYPLVSNV